jgi:hypothetical protein
MRNDDSWFGGHGGGLLGFGYAIKPLQFLCRTPRDKILTCNVIRNNPSQSLIDYLSISNIFIEPDIFVKEEKIETLE